MAAGLEPYHVDAIPASLRDSALDLVRESESPFAVALRIDRGIPVELPSELSAQDLAALLAWRDDAAPVGRIENCISRLETDVRTALDAAHEGTWSIGDAWTRLIANLATYLPAPRQSVADVLISVLGDAAAAAEWQFGALEGLTILRRAKRLQPRDTDRAAAFDLRPGRALFGEKISGNVLRAAQLRLRADQLDEEEIGWLAIQARGADAQTRLVAVTALGETKRSAIPAVDWSLVGGLFDPADDVVIRAMIAIETSEIGDDAAALVRKRLSDLYEHGARAIRRQVVVAARNHPTFDADEIVARARTDRAWSVRHAAVGP